LGFSSAPEALRNWTAAGWPSIGEQISAQANAVEAEGAFCPQCAAEIHFIDLMASSGCVASCVGLLHRTTGSSKCIWAVSRSSKHGQQDIQALDVFLGGSELFKQFATTDESGRRSSVTAARLNGSASKKRASSAELWLVAIFELYD